jgi:L-ascorbate metabolism protein UlaG (beta-lactamase superfamily)
MAATRSCLRSKPLLEILTAAENCFGMKSELCCDCAKLLGILGALLTAFVAASAAEPALTGDRVATKDGDLVIHPINHATLALGWKQLTIYVDPVGGAQRFAALPKPDLILLTDIHGDHLNADTLKAAATGKTQLVTPSAVAEQLPAELRPRATAIANGEIKTLLGLTVQAVPAYNTTPDRTKFHAKGRGNGYVLTFADKRVYLSGDTEDIPEMRTLKKIDVAFLCMNLPYTMTPEQAASAVREFRPKIVYPYHSRGSDLGKFKKLVGDDVGVEVRLRDWYGPQSSASSGRDQRGDSLPVIGHLEKRDRIITIKSGPHGPVYSVTTKDGKTLFENVSAEQLKAQAPEIHDLLKTGLATDARLVRQPNVELPENRR